MGKIALLFAGQGAQYPGMGQKICEVSEAARTVFAMAERLRPGTMRQCFEGSKEELALTVNTQPCIYTVDMACAAALSEAGVRAQGVAGFSLGELAALAYSGIVTEEQAFSLVCQRARLMDRCGDTQKGAMAAVLKLNNRTVEGLCREAGVFPVNYNCEGQLVAAGTENGIQKLIELCAKVGGKALRLPVSGAFHSPLMRDAARGLTRALRELTFKSPVMPIYANATAEPYGGDPADLLAQQVISPVLWQQTIENMVQNGYDTFVEAGPGRTLSSLVKKIAPEASVWPVQDDEGLKAAIEALGGSHRAAG